MRDADFVVIDGNLFETEYLPSTWAKVSFG